jgi:hypothetical protein
VRFEVTHVLKLARVVMERLGMQGGFFFLQKGSHSLLVADLF